MSAPSTSTDVVIHVDQLTRVYGSSPDARPAVDGISFTVSRGEVLGFLGPNGAGKSTTMKMLTCYLPPTSGRASVDGFDVYDQSLEVRRRIGYLPEDTPLYRDMTVLGYLQFTAQLRRIPAADRARRIRELGSLTGILSVLGKYIAELSRGFRQRVGLTQALLHDPPVLILDEPTSGLDPNQIVEIRELIREIGREKTVILSTHILPEVQATCNRVIIIRDGRLVADAKPEELVAKDIGNSRYRLLLASDGEHDVAEPEVRDALMKLAGARNVTSDPLTGAIEYIVTTEGATDLRRELFTLAARADWPVLELDRVATSLEDVFGRLTTTEAVGAKESADA